MTFSKTIAVFIHSVRKNLSISKNIVAMMLIFFYINDLIAPVKQFSSQNQVSIHPWLFPFITANWFDNLIITLGLVLLFCDAPFIDDTQAYVMLRAGKKNWLFGQFLYIGFVSFIYFAFLYILSIVLAIPSVDLQPDWGKAIGTLSQTDASNYFGIRMSFPYSIMLSYSPIQATLLAMLLFWLSGVFIGLLIFTINIMSKTAIGSFVAASIALLSVFTVNSSGYIMYYFSPLNWTSLSKLDITGTSPYPLVHYSIFLYLFFIVSLCTVNIVQLKKYELSTNYYK